MPIAKHVQRISKHVDSMHFRLLLTAIRIAPDLNGGRRLCFVYRCFFLVSLLVLLAGYHREVAHAFIHTHSEPFGRHLWARFIVRRFSPAKIKPADVDGVIYAPRIKALSQNAASSTAPNCTVTKTYNSQKATQTAKLNNKTTTHKSRADSGDAKPSVRYFLCVHILSEFRCACV